MIKKSVFENDLIKGMQVKLAELNSGQEMEDLEKAVDLLQEAAEIFDDLGRESDSEKIFLIIEKISECEPEKDRHTKDLTVEKQVKNLLDHGTQFNLSDDDILEVNDFDYVVDDTEEISEDSFLSSFEDEI